MTGIVILIFLAVTTVKADLNDVNSADSSSDTSSTGDMESNLDNNDPNLHNPQPRQGYGVEDGNPRWKIDQVNPNPSDKEKTETTASPTMKPSLSQQSLHALLQFGIIVGVAIMVGGMFMAMVGAEMLYNKICDKYRDIFHKPKPLPDIERLHPAELVGTFSRYK